MIKIKDFPNYSITECGVVWSHIGKEMHILVPRLHTKGYLFVELRKNSKGSQKLVHRLVAETFIDNPNNYPYVCHKDNNKRNPHKDNLFWGTHKMNMAHSRLSRRGTAPTEAADIIINRKVNVFDTPLHKEKQISNKVNVFKEHMAKKPPLTDLERQKAHNIRKTHPEVADAKAREIIKKPVWHSSNTHGNPKSKK